MTLPVLDKESYQHAVSEWVTHAAQALRAAGYLSADPSGVYDEEFAEAVAAFQHDRGISEENQVGPLTWDALGVRDTGESYGTDEVVADIVAVGTVSEDGQWQWDGMEWGAAAPAVATTETGQLSDDGLWRWDGTAWAAVTAAPADTKQVTGMPAPTGPSNYEDAELAGAIIDHEIGLLFQWKMALDAFDKVLTSETAASAKPDFAGAMTKLFTEKVFGEIFKRAKADIVVDVVKGLVAETERAKAAQKSVALRDFYTDHQDQIADLHKDLTVRRPGFVAAVRVEAERLINQDPDSYGMLRMELMDIHQDSLQRLQTATQQSLFAELSAEWTSQSKHRVSWDAEIDGEIRVKVREADLSVIDVEIKAPDGDKILEKLSRQRGGVDLWTMKAPKLFTFMNADDRNVGWVRVDAANRLANLPAERDGEYKRRYERLVANGGVGTYQK
jgi:peptidoglycan hydrolase-like protein with peptidoglycan-binding domain